MTKRPVLAAILALAPVAAALVPHPAIAQSGSPAGGAPTAPQREATPEESQRGTDVVYRPPLRGAPGRSLARRAPHRRRASARRQRSPAPGCGTTRSPPPSTTGRRTGTPPSIG